MSQSDSLPNHSTPFAAFHSALNSVTTIENGVEFVFTLDSQANLDYIVYYDFCEP